VLAAIAVLWSALAFSAPILEKHGGGGAAATAHMVRAVFSLVCHQNPERSFRVEGAPLALCARCTGIDVGFAGGCLGVLFLRLRLSRRTVPPGRAVLLLAMAPSALEAAAELAGLTSGAGGAVLRALTGALLGCACAFYVVPAFEELPEQIAGELRGLFSSPPSKPRSLHAETR